MAIQTILWTDVVKTTWLTKINANFVDLENRKVNNTGAETIGGVKTFSDNINTKSISSDWNIELSWATRILSIWTNDWTEKKIRFWIWSDTVTIKRIANALQIESYDDTIFVTRWSEIMRIDQSTGNVWIGTTTPNANFSIWTDLWTFDWISVWVVWHSTFRIGQDSTHNLITGWQYNSTVWSAYAKIETWGWNNNIAMQSNWGNVLIWTTTSSWAKLEVAWTMKMSVNNDFFRVENTDANWFNAILFDNDTWWKGIMFQNWSTRWADWWANTFTVRNDWWTLILWSVNHNTIMYGNVWINTSPWAKLDVLWIFRKWYNTDTTTNKWFTLASRYENSWILHTNKWHQLQFLWGDLMWSPETATNDWGWGLMFWTPALPLLMLSSNNVWIGTTVLSHKLTISWSWIVTTSINSTSTTGASILQFRQSSSNKGAVEYIGTAFATTSRQNSLEILTNSWTSADIVFRPNDVEAMRIESGGNIWMGTNSASKILEVYKWSYNWQLVARWWIANSANASTYLDTMWNRTHLFWQSSWWTLYFYWKDDSWNKWTWIVSWSTLS